MFFFFRGGKERLMQLLDYSSAAPNQNICQRECRRCHLQIRMNQAKIPEVASWAGITQGTNSVNLHAVLHSTADKKYGLFCKAHPPVSFVMSKFQKENLVKAPFHFVSQQRLRRRLLAVRPF